MFEKIFHLKENHTDVKTEVMAGITTFMTMAYILAVNPSILSASGMDANAVLIATSLASFVGTALKMCIRDRPEGMQPFYRGADCVVCNGELYGFRFEKEILKDRKSTRLNSSHEFVSRMPSSA